ncbi:hypothetical protein D3C72_1237120 [compost metagenome]
MQERLGYLYNDTGKHRHQLQQQYYTHQAHIFREEQYRITYRRGMDQLIGAGFLLAEYNSTGEEDYKDHGQESVGTYRTDHVLCKWLHCTLVRIVTEVVDEPDKPHHQYSNDDKEGALCNLTELKFGQIPQLRPGRNPVESSSHHRDVGQCMITRCGRCAAFLLTLKQTERGQKLCKAKAIIADSGQYDRNADPEQPVFQQDVFQWYKPRILLRRCPVFRNGSESNASEWLYDSRKCFLIQVCAHRLCNTAQNEQDDTEQVCGQCFAGKSR